MKKVWIKVVNDPQIENRYSDDWLHVYTVSTTPLELEPEEADDFVDLFELEIEDEATMFYVVLFFFENYFADHYAFTHLADATECFYEQIRTVKSSAPPTNTKSSRSHGPGRSPRACMKKTNTVTSIDTNGPIKALDGF